MPSWRSRGHREVVLRVLSPAERGQAQRRRGPAVLLDVRERGRHGRQRQEGHLTLPGGESDGRRVDITNMNQKSTRRYDHVNI